MVYYTIIRQALSISDLHKSEMLFFPKSPHFFTFLNAFSTVFQLGKSGKQAKAPTLAHLQRSPGIPAGFGHYDENHAGCALDIREVCQARHPGAAFRFCSQICRSVPIFTV
ncbi:MAG: hypothetical protein IJ595_00635 [Oscillospiraceae bacterium]|nr:hypothetical protein [Oscillospiraceae bacterium]